MRLKRRIKKSTKQYIIVAIICIVIIGGAAIFTSIIITKQMEGEYKTLLKEAYHNLEVNQREVYVSVTAISAGDTVTEKNMEIRKVYSSQPVESFITKETIGKTALINIPVNTQILKTMITDTFISTDLREMEYEIINISSNIINNDQIDVRIFFPNGEDYIILSKKHIKGLSLDSPHCLLWLTEEEILRMSSAIVDAYLYSGAKIYITKYIEPILQQASYITYEPSLSSLLLIQNNPNILETATNELSKQVRKAMENRLADSYGISVEEIEWELSPNQRQKDTAVSAPDKVITYKDELKEKEAEIDYGP
jgi:hypothetical protein